MVIDVIVADVPPKYGMLLSRSWGAKLQGTMQMDGSYATILVFSQLRRLYREAQMKFMVSSPKKPENSPRYFFHTKLDSFILCNEKFTDEPELEDIDANNRVEPTDFDIMDTLDIEENEEEMLEQCIEPEIQIEKNQDCEQHITHNIELQENL